MIGMWRIKTVIDRMVLICGSIRLLRNWRTLYGLSRRELRGEVVPDTPLVFRNGLQLNAVSGNGVGAYLYLFPDIFVEKCYQPDNNYEPQKNWTLVDVGANMGFYSCAVAYVEPSVRVVAIEPVRDYAEMLRKNIQLNGLRNVCVVEAAVCGEPVAQIPMTVWYTAAGEPKTSPSIPKTAARVDHFSVQGITLLELFSANHVDRCDLLKVDIEGAEYELFRNTPGEVWEKVQRVVMETHVVAGSAVGDLVQILERCNFHVQTRSNILWAWKG